MSSWYNTKKMQWSTSNSPATLIPEKSQPIGNPSDSEIEDELKRIQRLVSESKIPPTPKDTEENYEHIDL